MYKNCCLSLILLQLFFCLSVAAQKKQANDNFLLVIHNIGKNTMFDSGGLKLETVFNNETSINQYINKLPDLLAQKGYPAASIDSIWVEGRNYNVLLYTGKKYLYINLSAGSTERKILKQNGFEEHKIVNKPVNLLELQQLKEKLLLYYESSGYPFASVFLDSITLKEDRMAAVLKVKTGELYKLDSIKINGNVRVSNSFIRQYLDLHEGDLFNFKKLKEVDKQITNLSYLTMVQPSDINMLGNGAMLNIYVKPKRSSVFNFLVGFLPSSTGKVQLTGDVNLELKNTFGGAEIFLLKWQQLQIKSPRLNVGYSAPFVFRSRFGADINFDFFKKDSSYLQINAQLGTQYRFSGTQSGKLFVQWQNTSVLSGGVDTNQVKYTKQLPLIIDVHSVNGGLSYLWNNTNYFLNPARGNDCSITFGIGLKKIKENFDIVNIKDTLFNYRSLYDSLQKDYYQLRVKGYASHYFPVTKTTTLKTSFSFGLFQSPVTFRNELFQIGGNKLLRGFDEESIYATRYGVFTGEYRFLVQTNSYIYLFTDLATVTNAYQGVNVSNKFYSAGAGFFYETKLGLLNIAYAIGKRDDVKFNLREASKIHFGYTNFF